MGIITGGILGTVKQKVANVVFQKWKSLNTVREKVIPSNPRTPKQVFQRARFSFISDIAKIIRLTIIIPFWNYLSTATTTNWNEFSSPNIKAQPEYVDEVTPFEPNYSNLIMSKGSLEILDSPTTATYDNALGDYGISWEDTILGNGLNTDIVKLVIIDNENNISFITPGIAITRISGSISINIGAGRTIANLVCYLFCYRGEGDLIEVSNSHYSTTNAV